MNDTRLYDVLGVAPDASADAIKRAYKQLAREHHPDRKGGDAARFKEIGAAYEVLGDADKRKLYDEFGELALQSGFDPERARAASAAGFGGGVGDGRVDLEDLLRNMGGFGGFDFEGAGPFGGASPFGGGGGPARGRDLHAVVELDLASAIRGAEVELDLASAIRGAEVELDVPRAHRCRACGGSGSAEGATATACPTCGGAGQQEVVRGNLRMHATCTTCGGAGRRVVPCPRCHGAGSTRQSKRLTVRIPPGADDGSTIRLKGKGAPSPRGGAAGDLVIETRVAPHPLVTRDGLDLSMKLPVTLEEAYLGATVEVPTFDGPVRLRVPAGSQAGTRLRLRGKGVQRKERRGDLFVELDVRLPAPGDARLEAALRAMPTQASPRDDLRL